MRIELVPIIFAVVVGLLGVGLLFDAWTPDEFIVRRDRRRRPRIERSRAGEAWIGFGVLCMAAAFGGRDRWRYSVIAVIAGTLFLLCGAVLNRRYFAESISNRGALRRRDKPSSP
ncbi:MAG TPA: hypothetical protein VHV78_16430 [Gemmatimonadaceae bacterium]|nr:hypothetical protein [Gemmatimonadaceae bacterium]